MVQTKVSGYGLHLLLLPVALLDLHGTVAAQLSVHFLHSLDSLEGIRKGDEPVSLRPLV